MNNPDACAHEDLVTAADAEIVCRGCGAVVGMQCAEPAAAESRTSLFLETEVGGKPDKTLPASRYADRGRKDLAVVSSIAQKLGLPGHACRDVWYWYEKLRASLSMTRSKVAVLAFHQVCRFYGVPLDEAKLRRVVGVYLGARYVPTALGALMEASSFIDEAGELVVARIGFTDLANRAPSFLMNCEVRSLQERYPPEVAEKVGRVAREVCSSLGRNDERDARIAMMIAKRRCGV